jgi:hypothetical protein
MSELLAKKQINSNLYRFKKYLENNFTNKIDYLKDAELEEEKVKLNTTIEQTKDKTDEIMNQVYKEYLTNLRKDFIFVFRKLDQLNENFDKTKTEFKNSKINNYLIKLNNTSLNQKINTVFRINQYLETKLIFNESYLSNKFELNSSLDDIIVKNANANNDLNYLITIKQSKVKAFKDFMFDQSTSFPQLQSGRLNIYVESDPFNLNYIVSDISSNIEFANHFNKYMEFYINSRNRSSLYINDFGRGQDVGGLTRDYISRASNGFTSSSTKPDIITPFKFDNQISYFNIKFNDLGYYENFGKLIALSLLNKVRLNIKLHPSIIYGILFLTNIIPENHTFSNLLKEKRNNNLPKIFRNEEIIKQDIINTIENKYYGFTREMKDKEKNDVSGLKSFKLSNYVFDNSIPISNDTKKTFTNDRGFEFEFDINFILEVFNYINESYKDDLNFDFINEEKYDSICMYRTGFICPEMYLEAKYNSHQDQPEHYYYAEIVAENYIPKLKEIVKELIPDFTIDDVSAQILLDNLIDKLEDIYQTMIPNTNIKQEVDGVVLKIEEKLLAINSRENLSYELLVIDNIKNVKMPKIIKNFSDRRQLQFLYNYFYQHIEKIRAIQDGIYTYIQLKEFSKVSLKTFLFEVFGLNYTLEDFFNKIIFTSFVNPGNEEVKNVFKIVITEYYNSLESASIGSGQGYLGKILYYITGSFSLPKKDIKIKAVSEIIEEKPWVRMYAHTCFKDMDYLLLGTLEDYDRFFKIDFNPETFTGKNSFSNAKKYIKLNDYMNY